MSGHSLSFTSAVHRPRHAAASILTLLAGAHLGLFGAALNSGDRGICYLVALLGSVSAASLAAAVIADPAEDVRGTAAKTRLLLGLFALCLFALGTIAVWLSGVPGEYWTTVPK